MSGALGRLAATLARVMLLLYPAAARREVGPAMLADIRDRVTEVGRRRGRVAALLALLRTLASLAGNAMAEWRDGPAGSGAAEGLARRSTAVRLAVRSLARSPGHTVVVILTLALGIGGTTAVFGAVRAVLMEPLPFPEPDRLVRLYNGYDDAPDAREFVTATHYLHYREHATSFESLAAMYTYQETGADLMIGDFPERVRRLEVSPQYFAVYGVEPVLGRTFAPDEERAEALAVVSERLWRRLGDGRAGLGGTVELDGEAHTVVGVVPAGFRDPLVGEVHVWVPENLHSGGAEFSGNHFLTVVGRLADGVTPDQARAEMAALDRRLAELYPDEADETLFNMVPLHADVVGSARTVLYLLMGAVAVVLLIACVNVANLQMVRAVGRGPEVAVRAALGAGRGRIAGELLTESLVLAVVAGAAGVLVALGGVRALTALGSGALPRSEGIGVDGPVLAFAAVLALGTGLAFGLVPALRTARRSPAGTLRTGSSGAWAGPGAGRLRWMLVSGQVALAFVLVVGASVLAASVYRLAQVDLGVKTEGVLTFELNLPTGYDADGRRLFHEELARRLAEAPGVESVGAAQWLPATGTAFRWGAFARTGPLAGTEEGALGADQRIVVGDYFTTLGIPLLEGRLFDSRDGPDAPRVAVVSRSVAERLFTGAPAAVGQSIRVAGDSLTIVGVVEDVAMDGEGMPWRHVYHPHAQFADRDWTMQYLVAGPGDPGALLAGVREVVRGADPALVVHRPATLDEVLGRSREERRFAFVLGVVFAGLALLLAVLGLYGVLAQLVHRRRREIGIRMALGAHGGEVARIVVGRGVRITLAGLVLGVAGSLAAGRLLTSLVFETRPTDPVLMVGAAAALLAAAVVATAVPTFRALAVPPRTTLAE